MKTTGNTILITGGTAGIGFQIAKLFSENGNQVIITGRDEERLRKAAEQLGNVTAIVSDVTDPAQVSDLVARLKNEYPALNVVINNAGKVHYYPLTSQEGVAKLAGEEMLTNYLSVIHLNEMLIPLLKNAPEAAIVTVSSIAALVPNHILPTYAASKAALHSYSQSLRITLSKDTNIKVFELMPPLVNTDFSQVIGGANGIAPQQVASDLLEAFKTDTYEVMVGKTADVFKLFLHSPEDALRAMNPGVAIPA